MTTMYVTYYGDNSSRFDCNYYVQQHLPLVAECWTPLGLLSCTAFFPVGKGAGTIAIAECKFRDDAALQAALNSPETPRVMDDIPRFTDVRPARSHGLAI